MVVIFFFGGVVLFWGLENLPTNQCNSFFSQSVVTKVLGHNWTVQPSNGWESLFGKEEG